MSQQGGDEPMMDLPAALVEAVLELDPMQRASLGALILGSLASELVDARRVATPLVVHGKTKTARKR